MRSRKWWRATMGSGCETRSSRRPSPFEQTGQDTSGRHRRCDRSDPPAPRAGDLHDGLIYDAVRVRLIEIGEAVEAINPELLAEAPQIPWGAIARMRDHLAHHYFDTDHAIVQDVVETELSPLLDAVRMLVDRAEVPGPDGLAIPLAIHQVSRSRIRHHLPDCALHLTW